MKLKKNLFFIAGACAVMLLLVVIAAIKIAFYARFTEKELRNHVSWFCKAVMNRATNFEDISITPFGNIVLTNFNLSVSSDFNDNLSIISARKAVFKLDFIDALMGKPVVAGVRFSGAQVVLFERYGKNYLETGRLMLELFKGSRRAENIDAGDFTLEITESSAEYRQVFLDTKLTAECEDFYLKVRARDGVIDYKVTGMLKPNQSPELAAGSLFLKGSYNLRTNACTLYSTIDSFDLSYLNSFIASYELAPVNLRGGLSLDLRLERGDRGKLRVRGSIETGNLHVIDRRADGPTYLSNENVTLTLDCGLSADYSRLDIGRFELSDGIMDVRLEGMLERNRAIALDFSTNDINLEALSGNITPVKGLSFGGTLAAQGKIRFDLAKALDTGSAGLLRLDGFTCRRYRQGKHVTLVRNCSGDIRYGKNAVAANLSLQTGDSALSLRGDGVISSWAPFRSDSGLTLFSHRMSGRLLGGAIALAGELLMKGAYDDIKLGYDDIFFLKKPLGEVAVNNSLAVRFSIDTIVIGAGAQLKNARAGIDITRGEVALRDFSIEGYDATYELGVEGFFNRDFPWLKLTGKMSGFDLGRFYREAGYPGSVAGKAALDLSYEINAYRLSQLLENSKTSATLTITEAALRRTPFQDMFADYLRKNNGSAVQIGEINIPAATLTVGQGGPNFSCSLSFPGDALQGSGYGTYVYSSGFNVPLSATVKTESGMVSVPVKVSGELLAPCLGLPQKPKSETRCYAQ